MLSNLAQTIRLKNKKGLREEMDKTPTSQESLVGAYAIMATEIVVRKERAGDSIDGKVADQLMKDTVALGKFMAGQLQLTKKAVAGKIQDGLDKLLKDSRTGIARAG